MIEDIVQETIIRAWRNIDRLLGMDGSVRSRLFTVTRHLVVDWVRKPLLCRLSPEHRAVLVHIYLCDRSIQETAGILGVPAGTVKSRQHNALRKLRTVMRPSLRVRPAARARGRGVAGWE